MPASAVVQTEVTGTDEPGVDIVGAWVDFLAAEEAARTARNAAWAELDQGGAASTAQGIFDAYRSTFATAFDNAQNTFATAINQVAEFFEAAFDAFQAYLSGAGTVADVVGESGKLDNGIDGAARAEGQLVQEALANSADRALLMTVTLSDFATSEEFDFSAKALTHCEKVTLQSEGRSKAWCSIPFKDWEDTVPAVSAIGSSPAANIAGGTRGLVHINGAGKIPVFIGSVREDSHQLTEDGYGFELEDDKMFLEGVHIVGSFHWDPVAKQIIYNNAGTCTPNEDGRPNCIDSDWGPMFALEPDYNLAQGEPIPAHSTTQARYWTHEDFLNYLWLTTYTGSTAFQKIRAAVQYFPMYNFVWHTRTVWPVGFGSGVKGDGTLEQGGAAAARGMRDGDLEKGTAARMREHSFDGMDLEEAIPYILRSAGAYELYMGVAPSGDKSMMMVVPTRFRPMHTAAGTRDVVRRSGTMGDPAAPKVSAGAIHRDFGRTFSSVWVLGDVVHIEARLTYDPDDINNSTLYPSWNFAEELNLRSYINETPDIAKTREAWVNAMGIFPLVFNAYKINPWWNYLTGTKYENFPRLPNSPQILRHLLTWQVDQSDGSLLRRLPYPVPVEIKNADTGAWELLTYSTGMEIDRAGNIYFPGLRESADGNPNGGTWLGTYRDPHGFDDMDNMMRPRALRITVAIRTNIRVCECMALSGADVSGGGNNDLGLMRFADPNAGRQGIAVPFERQEVIVTDDYREYLRLENAFPIPESVDVGYAEAYIKEQLGEQGMGKRTGKPGFPELLNEHPLAASHAQRRFAAVAKPHRTAALEFEALVPWRPGTVVVKLKTEGPISGTWRTDGVVGKCTLNYQQQASVIDLQ